MALAIDHIFICTDTPAQVADDLLAFGLQEGSSRAHPGQGTANRKFYFGDFFLELLWATDPTLLREGPAAQTLLWQRLAYQTTGVAPYGLCLAHTPETDPLFANSLAYQPDYFPLGKAIDVLPHEAHPMLPWAFRLPFAGPPKHHDEPSGHPNGVRKLDRAVFGVPPSYLETNFAEFFAQSPVVVLAPHTQYSLTLCFDGGAQSKAKQFPALGLTIEY